MHPKPFENSLIIAIFVKYMTFVSQLFIPVNFFDFATQDKRHLANYGFGKNDQIM